LSKSNINSFGQRLVPSRNGGKEEDIQSITNNRRQNPDADSITQHSSDLRSDDFVFVFPAETSTLPSSLRSATGKTVRVADLLNSATDIEFLRTPRRCIDWLVTWAGHQFSFSVT
jgi:hypothetical protein